MELMREFGLALEPVVGGAFRALALLQSTLELLAPDFDLLDEAKSYGHAILRPPWSPTSPSSPRDELEAALPTLVPTLLALPRRLDRVVESVQRNELVMGVHLFPNDRDRRFINQLTASLVVTIAGASTGLIGGLLILAANPRLTTDTGRLLQAVGIGCIGVALLVLLRALVAALRRLRERP
jgi:ubiquinone biosynthesis protein